MDEELDQISQTLKTNRDNIVKKAQALNEAIRAKEKEIEELKKKLASDIVGDIINSSIEVDGIRVVSYKLEDMDMDSLRNIGDEVRNKLGSGVVVLASVSGNKLTFLAMATKDLVKKGIMSGNIVREVAKVTGGNGGGRPDMAQAGGKDPSKVDEALAIVPDLVRSQLN